MYRTCTICGGIHHEDNMCKRYYKKHERICNRICKCITISGGMGDCNWGYTTCYQENFKT